MALQTSGTISMGQIFDELSDSTRPSPIAMSSLENGTYRPLTRYPYRPSGTTPCTFSEWYGYQGGHKINVKLIPNYYDGYISTNYSFDCFSDDNNSGYEYLSGVFSGNTTFFLENPLFFYTDLMSGCGSVYFYFSEFSLYGLFVPYLEFYNASGAHLSSNYTYYADTNNGYIYYFVDSGVTSPYFEVRIYIDFL